MCVFVPPEYLSNQLESSNHQSQLWYSLKIHIFLGYYFSVQDSLSDVFSHRGYIYSYKLVSNASLPKKHIFSKWQLLFDQSYFLFTDLTYISDHIKETPDNGI